MKDKPKPFRLSRWARFKIKRRRKDIIKPYIRYRNKHDIFRGIKRYFRNHKIKKDSKNARKLLAMIDINMKRVGWSRQKRRRFWRAFFKHPEFREDLFVLMGKD